MSTSSLSEAHTTAVQPSLDDLLEEADDAHGQTAQARMHDAEAAMDAVRRKFGSAAAQFGA
jgi:DNA polymerase-4